MPVSTLSQRLERRRRRAIALLTRGYSQAAVARRLGVSRSSVSRWQALLRNGPHKLAATTHPGRPHRLTPSQLHALQQLLRVGATAYSWPTDRWTAARVTALIFRTFEVEYHPDHVRKIMKKLNFEQETTAAPENQRDARGKEKIVRRPRWTGRPNARR